MAISRQFRSRPRLPLRSTAPSGLLTMKRIDSHIQSSPVEHLALSFEHTSTCVDDIQLLKVLRAPRTLSPQGNLISEGSPISTNASHSLAPSTSAILTATDAVFFPVVVQDLLPMVPHLPASSHELLLLLSRFYHNAESKDASSGIGQQMVHLLDNAKGVTGTSTSQSLAQVRFIAMAALIDSETDATLGPLEREIQGHGCLIPAQVLETLLTVSIPRLCKVFIRHTIQHSNGWGYDHAFVFTLWAALLCNDYFFNAIHFDEMHACLMLLVSELPLQNMVRATSTMVPVLNKTSRVYCLSQKGFLLHSLHSTYFGHMHPEALRHMPWQYHTRMIGGILDEVAASEARTYTESSDLRVWRDIIVPSARHCLAFFSNNPDAVSTLWKVTFKAALVFPSGWLAYLRAGEAYALFAEAGAVQAMNKDQFSQLVRLYCDAITAGELGSGEAGSVASEVDAKAQLGVLFAILVATPSVTLHWAMNAVDTLLAAVCAAPAMMPGSAKTALGAAIHNWLCNDYFVKRKVAATDPLNVATIRKSLEDLGAIPESPFWWACGCTALNTCHSEVCSKCMRNDHVRWRCVGCGAQQHGNSHTCTKCGAVHPMITTAEKVDVPLCDRCVITPLDEDQLCPKCDINIGKSGRTCNSYQCGSCGHNHTSKVVCPRCGVKVNDKEQLAMWLCEGCGSYSYLFNKRCTRCAAGASRESQNRRVPQRTTTSFRTDYAPWQCGCGKLNPMTRLGCMWCGNGKSFTCPSCDQLSACDKLSHLTVSTQESKNVKLPTSLCHNCGDVHPRDASVLANSGVLTNCYNCGGHCSVGASACQHCSATLDSFNPMLPFWCGSCEEGKKAPQRGFACQHCSTPRSEIEDCAYLWRCTAVTSQKPDNGDDAAPSHCACNHWNPSWQSTCSACAQLRVYDSAHEVRTRNCGKWRCGACDQINGPENVLICGHCDEGLHVPSPCKSCGRLHISMECPTEDLLAHAADLLDDLQMEGLLM